MATTEGNSKHSFEQPLHTISIDDPTAFGSPFWPLAFPIVRKGLFSQKKHSILSQLLETMIKIWSFPCFCSITFFLNFFKGMLIHFPTIYFSQDYSKSAPRSRSRIPVKEEIYTFPLTFPNTRSLGTVNFTQLSPRKKTLIDQIRTKKEGGYFIHTQDQ